MEKGKRKASTSKEKTKRCRSKSGETSGRRRRSDSDPAGHRKPKRPTQDVTSNDVFIQKLPPEILKMIFEYLDLPDICRAGRVCKEWRRLSRIAQFWRRISVTLCNDNWFRLIQYLPSCVTYINLCSESELMCISYFTFSSTLYRKCPNLDTLIMHGFSFMRGCTNRYPILGGKLRVLVLTSCKFVIGDSRFREVVLESMSSHVCAIEVFDLSYSRFMDEIYLRDYDFGCKNMKKLKKLHLTGCNLNQCLADTLYSIRTIQLLNLEQNNIGYGMFWELDSRAIHLTELYVCWNNVNDRDLIVTEGQSLPKLEKICLRGCRVTSVGINSLIASCSSLRCVVVGEEVPNPAYDYSKCNLEIVTVVNGFKFCNHNKTALNE